MPASSNGFSPDGSACCFAFAKRRFHTMRPALMHMAAKAAKPAFILKNKLLPMQYFDVSAQAV